VGDTLYGRATRNSHERRKTAAAGAEFSSCPAHSLCSSSEGHSTDIRAPLPGDLRTFFVQLADRLRVDVDLHGRYFEAVSIFTCLNLSNPRFDCDLCDRKPNPHAQQPLSPKPSKLPLPCRPLRPKIHPPRNKWARRQAPSQQTPPVTSKLSSELVQLVAAVTDRHRAFVTDLNQNDFHILDNGHPEGISYFQPPDRFCRCESPSFWIHPIACVIACILSRMPQ